MSTRLAFLLIRGVSVWLIFQLIRGINNRGRLCGERRQWIKCVFVSLVKTKLPEELPIPLRDSVAAVYLDHIRVMGQHFNNLACLRPTSGSVASLVLDSYNILNL